MKNPIFLYVLLFCLLGSSCYAQTLRLYQSQRTTGVIQEVDLNTGTVLASNVGGLTGARGMAFSPLGGLYVAHGNAVSRIPNAVSPASTVLNLGAEIPHDLNFDAAGNLYLITHLNIHIFDPALNPVRNFPHGLTTTTGDGNPNKGWGIAIRPDNGEIYAIGNQGLRRFDPATGAQIGTTIGGSGFGLAGITFTPSGFNGAYLYVGNVISGVDQIRVYDTNLNLLRTFFAPHNGNPIDLEVNPLTGELYLFNTVTTNPVNQFSSSEVVSGTFNSGANPSQGSALGDFNGIILEEEEPIVREELSPEVPSLEFAIRQGVAELDGQRAGIAQFQIKMYAFSGQTLGTWKVGGPQASLLLPSHPRGVYIFRIWGFNEQGKLTAYQTLKVAI